MFDIFSLSISGMKTAERESSNYQRKTGLLSFFQVTFQTEVITVELRGEFISSVLPKLSPLPFDGKCFISFSFELFAMMRKEGVPVSLYFPQNKAHLVLVTHLLLGTVMPRASLASPVVPAFRHISFSMAKI